MEETLALSFTSPITDLANAIFSPFTPGDVCDSIYINVISEFGLSSLGVGYLTLDLYLHNSQPVHATVTAGRKFLSIRLPCVYAGFTSTTYQALVAAIPIHMRVGTERYVGATIAVPNAITSDGALAFSFTRPRARTRRRR